ncbi:ABC transporter ATP-binding protein [Balneolaceae bacterium YR4-1]|uniref:ABC transporter ATP-binding protein n=1 Tax=Halalkalibaculum roseum TaxID=2709311 RepID=A0A6M1T077_9BACT|nr:ABC transporter ATP-binding protein [Halalkalibaculum roseum]NGP76167.1 ABC transporter ATP-binding protein [Halalkalibaculum roseum]
MTEKNVVLHTEDLKIGYKAKGGQETIVAEHIDVDLHSGELICLLGPNGSGKSTLIKTLAGVHSKLGGQITVFNESIDLLSRKEIAHRLSTVLTDRVTVGNLSVYNLVAFGRSPYTGWLGSLSKEDEEKVRWAIEATGLKEFVNRDINKLSDGELQKVMIARALAQDTSVILLDEPTAHLDLPNRVEIIRLLRKLAHETGKGILLSTHELDLALKAGDRIWLMNREKELFKGVPEDLVLNGTFEEVFKKDSFDFDIETGSFKIHRHKDKIVSVNGDPVPVFWTRRALEREGYRVVEGEGASLTITAQTTKESYRWQINDKLSIINARSVYELLSALRKENLS